MPAIFQADFFPSSGGKPNLFRLVFGLHGLRFFEQQIEEFVAHQIPVGSFVRQGKKRLHVGRAFGEREEKRHIVHIQESGSGIPERNGEPDAGDPPGGETPRANRALASARRDVVSLRSGFHRWVFWCLLQRAK
jgi:hypothetical protein